MAAGLLAALFAFDAGADWIEASGDHFVIYADRDANDVKPFAERLERFHAAMALRFDLRDAKPSASNRVTIFVISTQRKAYKFGDLENQALTGFYLARAGATVAVIPSLQRETHIYGNSPETLLFHEYAHHVLFGVTARAFPRWFTEGFAEFYGNVGFEPDGGVRFAAPIFREMQLFSGYNPIRTLLSDDGGFGPREAVDGWFYARSWLLFHYLMFAPERAGQLSQYQALLGSGKPALEAATAAFGDLRQLAVDVGSYGKRSLRYLVIPGSALKTGAISMRTLRPGESEMMPTKVELRVGVTKGEAAGLVPDAREIAERYPDDPHVLATLAEVEVEAGHDESAVAAADRALALAPGDVHAHIAKGNALFHKAHVGDLPKETWPEVRKQFARANQAENDNPIPLIRFYQTFGEQGKPPTRNAIDGLEWALALAPYDASLRRMVAGQMIADGRLKHAATVLGPLAYSPHPGEDTVKALQLLKDVEARIERGEDKTVE